MYSNWRTHLSVDNNFKVKTSEIFSRAMCRSDDVWGGIVYISGHSERNRLAGNWFIRISWYRTKGAVWWGKMEMKLEANLYIYKYELYIYRYIEFYVIIAFKLFVNQIYNSRCRRAHHFRPLWIEIVRLDPQWALLRLMESCQCSAGKSTHRTKQTTYNKKNKDKMTMIK